MQQQPYRAPAAAQGGLPRVEPERIREQRADAGRPVPRNWWAAHGSDAERIDRLLGDADLVTRLKLSDFSGVEYDRFAEELARYGLAVMNAWMFNGTIFEKAKKHAFGGLPPLPDRGWDRDDRTQLADDTVITSLIKFRDNVLLPGKWVHTRGATLKTYFVGQCLMCFANEYRAWINRVLQHRQHQVPLPDFADQWISRGVGPEHEVVLRDEVLAGLADLPDDRIRTVLIMTEMGFQQQEIAQKLSMTVKAVEMILRRHRHRLARSEGNRHEAS